MAINKYFNLHGVTAKNTNERNLINNLVTEAIRMFGVDVHYIERTLVAEDHVFGEDPLSSFSKTFVIEAYIETVEGWDGEGDVLSSMGLVFNDIINMQFSTTAFHGAVGKAPTEGDLIWFPISKSMVEIKFVETESQFYPTGTLPSYKVKCEKFNMSGENFTTGVTEIDNIGAIDIIAHGDNTAIQTESNTILDFTEANPWGNF